MSNSIRKAYVDTSGGQIHAHMAGEGDTTVVFLQQTASSGRMFYKVMEHLAGGRRMIALDTPGFGGSFDPEGMPSLPDYTDWIAEAIEGLGLTNVHLVGHHTGVCIAAELAVRHDWVASVAMMGPVVLTSDERDEFRQHFGTPFAPTADGSYLLATWNYLAGLGANSDLELHHREMVDTLRAYYGRFQAYSAVWDQDFAALYQQIRQPIAIMCAPEDVLWPYFDRAKQARPDARAFELRGANFEPDQDAEGCVAALTSFWNALN